MTRHKKQFRRFESFYKSGELQPHFIEQLKKEYEDGFKGEEGVVQSWFDYCEEKHGKIKQPELEQKDNK